MSDQRFLAGIGRTSITPPMSAPHAGWGAQLHLLPDGIAQDLWATVLVVDDGDERAAFCELELVILSREENDAIRRAIAEELGITSAQVRCSVSHNHAGPPPRAWDWISEGADALRTYYESLPSRAAGAARQAKLALAPARAGWGRGACHVAVNRRETSPTGRTVTGVNPDGPIDPEVLVVRFDTLDGTPIGSIVGYTMHPTFLGPSNTLISSDWPGQMRVVVEQITGAPCLFAQGATGDIGPGPLGFSDDHVAMRAVGGQVGCEAARVFLSIELPPVRHEHDRVQESGAPLGLWKGVPLPEESVRVRTRSVSVTLSLDEQMPIDEAEGRVAAAQGHLDELRATGAANDDIESATFVTKRANMTLFRSREYFGKTETQIELHLFQIGPIVFAGIEGEPFHETGLRIKGESPFPATWFGGYTSGWAGYIPTVAERSRAGYEVDTAPFSETAVDELAEQVVAALKQLTETA